MAISMLLKFLKYSNDTQYNVGSLSRYVVMVHVIIITQRLQYKTSGSQIKFTNWIP